MIEWDTSYHVGNHLNFGKGNVYCSMDYSYGKIIPDNLYNSEILNQFFNQK